MDWSIIPKSCPLHTSVALQEAAVTLVPGSAFAKSDFCAVIVYVALIRQFRGVSVSIRGAGTIRSRYGLIRVFS